MHSDPQNVVWIAQRWLSHISWVGLGQFLNGREATGPVQGSGEVWARQLYGFYGGDRRDRGDVSCMVPCLGGRERHGVGGKGASRSVVGVVAVVVVGGWVVR